MSIFRQYRTLMILIIYVVLMRVDLRYHKIILKLISEIYLATPVAVVKVDQLNRELFHGVIHSSLTLFSDNKVLV